MIRNLTAQRRMRGSTRAIAALTAVICSLTVTPGTAHAALKISPQTVVDLSLSRGTRAKGAELTAQRSYLKYYQALGALDLQFKFNPYYEYNEAQTIAGIGNIIDRTLSVDTVLSKKFRTGTTVALEYINTQQNSTLPLTSTRTSNIALDSVQVELRQNIWRDAFGYADRLAIEIGDLTIQSAQENREEDLEVILLDAITAFWNTYTAERELSENLSAREKYQELVKSVRRKAGFNLSTPGELPRLEAEMENAEQKVKASSASYLNAVTTLLTTMRVETKENVELVVPPELPPVPQLKAKDLESLRVLKTARKNLSIAEKNYSLVQNQNRPQLDLVARARSTGVEERNSDAVAELQGGTKPTYYLGVEFVTPFGSDLVRGLEADADIQRRSAENDLTTASDDARDKLVTLERTVTSQYAVTKSSIDVVEFRARVVRDLEAAYRQGRQPLVELIRAYNDLFAAQLEKARAIGQYHINLNQLAAARDELVSDIGR